ncbi:sensor histidine kinase [bacterium]|nr:sensor histidine kinase [bacterium]
MNLQPVKVLFLSSSSFVTDKVRERFIDEKFVVELNVSDIAPCNTENVISLKPDLIILDFSKCELTEALLCFEKLITLHTPIISIIPVKYLSNARDFIYPGTSDYSPVCEECIYDIVHIAKRLLFSNKLYKRTLGISSLENEIIGLKNEKKFLLKEVYHRVGNLLQIVCSLLELELRNIKDEDLSLYFESSITRIRSLSLIHSIYMQSMKEGKVDFEKYARSLAEHQYRIHKISPSSVKLDIISEINFFNQDKIFGFGLIVNELLSNSLVHAFPDSHRGEKTIKISLKKKENKIELEVRDNGKGFPPGFNVLQASTLGFKLVNILVEMQMKGKLICKNDRGGLVRVVFPC